jgi:3-dehydroquinate dehydratase-2
MKILIINGPNLNKLGKRDVTKYGSYTLDDIAEYLSNSFPDIDFTFYQSNFEGDIINVIQNAEDEFDAIIINPGAYSHYSYAIKDALLDCKLPKIEVHLSNIFAREEYRHNSVTASTCDGLISGLKKESYYLAVQAIINLFKGLPND